MNQQQFIEALRTFGITQKLSHEKTLKSAVTSEWGVAWDEEMIARDLMQNFFDANRDRINDICVTTDGSHVAVSAPTPFSLERLYYLGSEKDENDVGQYGEGFKAAAVCLLRKFPHALLVSVSEHQVLWIHFDDSPVATTNLHPLVYEFFRAPRKIDGYRLVIRNTAASFAAAMSRGLEHFYYEGNPILGAPLVEDYGGRFILRNTSTSDGHIFYRKLKRGDIPKIPVCLVVSKEYQDIEKRISSDRDRKAFGDDLRKGFYTLCAKYFFKGNRRAQQAVVEAARPLWERGEGHPLLAEIAAQQRSYWQSWDDSSSRTVFQDRFFARSHSADANVQVRYQEIEREWVRQGRTGLPGYFEAFGVISAMQHLQDLEKKARHDAAKTQHRAPSAAEFACIGMLGGVVRSLAPDLMAIFDNRRTTYSVAETDVVLGELKQAREYRSREVFLAAQLFESDLAQALAVFLHEHAHIFGYDGSRGFTDALTELIETVIRSRKTLDEVESRWEAARKKVLRERKKAKRSDQGGPGERLDALSATELRTLLQKIPPAYLSTLLSNNEET